MLFGFTIAAILFDVLAIFWEKWRFGEKWLSLITGSLLWSEFKMTSAFSRSYPTPFSASSCATWFPSIHGGGGGDLFPLSSICARRQPPGVRGATRNADSNPPTVPTQSFWSCFSTWGHHNFWLLLDVCRSLTTQNRHESGRPWLKGTSQPSILWRRPPLRMGAIRAECYIRYQQAAPNDIGSEEPTTTWHESLMEVRLSVDASNNLELAELFINFCSNPFYFVFLICYSS